MIKAPNWLNVIKIFFICICNRCGVYEGEDDKDNICSIPLLRLLFLFYFISFFFDEFIIYYLVRSIGTTVSRTKTGSVIKICGRYQIVGANFFFFFYLKTN